MATFHSHHNTDEAFGQCAALDNPTLLRAVDNTVVCLCQTLDEGQVLDLLLAEAKLSGWAPELRLTGLRLLKPTAAWAEAVGA